MSEGIKVGDINQELLDAFHGYKEEPKPERGGVISLEDALSIVNHYGPTGSDVNETFQIQMVLRDAVEQLQAELASVTAGKVTIVKEKFYPADKELIEQLQAEKEQLREAFDLEVNRCFWLLEQGSPAKWITHSEDYLKLIRQLAVDAPYIKSFEERSGIGMDKAWAFTGDSGKAIKFDSKEKADYFAKEERLFEHGVVAIGHVFMEMPATNEEKLNHIAKAIASTDSSNCKPADTKNDV